VLQIDDFFKTKKKKTGGWSSSPSSSERGGKAGSNGEEGGVTAEVGNGAGGGQSAKEGTGNRLGLEKQGKYSNTPVTCTAYVTCTFGVSGQALSRFS
jgi:hypothetical protein